MIAYLSRDQNQKKKKALPLFKDLTGLYTSKRTSSETLYPGQSWECPGQGAFAPRSSHPLPHRPFYRPRSVPRTFGHLPVKTLDDNRQTGPPPSKSNVGQPHPLHLGPWARSGADLGPVRNPLRDRQQPPQNERIACRPTQHDAFPGPARRVCNRRRGNRSNPVTNICQSPAGWCCQQASYPLGYMS